MVEEMNEWRNRGKGGNSLDGVVTSNGTDNVNLPSGPGEWEEGLGLPLCVVCQNVRKPPGNCSTSANLSSSLTKSRC